MSGQTATVEMVRMGAIEERRSLNPRGRLNHEVIQEYVRRLENGETPPPLVVHRGKGVLFSGAHRYQAYRQFFEKRGLAWEDQKVPVIYRDDLPDPDEEPELFRALAAIENRDHGVRVGRPERAKVLIDLARTRGQEVVRQYAALFNETPESVEELLRIFGMAEDAASQALQQEAEASVKGEGRTESSAIAEPKARPLHGVKYRPEAFPTGHLKGARPVVKVAVRRFRESIGPYLHDLTEAERDELRELVQWLEAALYASKVA